MTEKERVTDAINDYLKGLNQSSPAFKFEDEIGQISWPDFAGLEKAICNNYISGEIQEDTPFRQKEKT